MTLTPTSPPPAPQLYAEDLAEWIAETYNIFQDRDQNGSLWNCAPGVNHYQTSTDQPPPSNNALVTAPSPAGYFGGGQLNFYMLDPNSMSYNDADWHHRGTFYARDGSLYDWQRDEMAHEQIGTARPNWARMSSWPNHYLTEEPPSSYEKIGFARFDFFREPVGSFFVWRDGLTLPSRPVLDIEPTAVVRFW